MARPYVLLVPGFLGSSIFYSHFLGRRGERQLWMNPTALVGGAFSLLALPLADQPSLPGARPPTLDSYPMRLYYGLLHSYLERNGWEVEEPLADFRKPLSYDGAHLVRAIERYAKNEPVRIVCHSRGGLLTRWALAALAAAGKPGLVSRVIGLGVPHRGSLNAVATLAGYASVVQRILSLGARAKGIIGTGLGLQTVKHVLRSWPALYELLPDPARSWLAPADAAKIYDIQSWVRCDPPPYPPYLAAASATWAALPDPPPSVEWVDVAGIGLDTYASLPPVEHWAERGYMSTTLAGDSTVLASSAHVEPRKRVYVPCQHDMLPADSRLWPVISRILRDGLQANESIDGPILTSPF